MPEVPPIASPPVDVSLVGGPRGDVLVGQAGANLLEGRGGNDTLTGGPADDILDGGPGDDTLNGGDGLDTARYRGSIFDYTITRGDGGATVRSNNPGSPGNDGNDQLTGIERLEFQDRAIYVNGINNRPVGRPDQGFETPEGVPLRVPAASLLANDVDFDNDPLSITAVENSTEAPPGASAGGSVRLENGTIVYTPNSRIQWPLAAGDSYEEVVHYTVSDGRGGEDIQSVKFTVRRPSGGVGAPPQTPPDGPPSGGGGTETPPGGDGSTAIPAAEAQAAAAATFGLWSDTAMPAVASVTDTRSTQLGVKFRADTDGLITGLRFYKGAQNTGTHVGTLWTNTGTSLGTVTFANETASGWQTATFTNPIQIQANTTYVASYLAPSGGWATTDNYFSSAYTNGHLTALANTTGSSGNGVFASNASATTFPTRSGKGTNYWVDVVFEPSTTTPPPAAGFNVVQTGSGTAVTEGGATDTFTMALASAPTANVVVTINGTADVTGAPSTLTFTQANWQTAQTVTVTAVNDTDAEGQETSNLTFSTSSTDTRYNNFNVDPIAVTVTDTSTPPTNRNPVAANDSSTTNEDTPVTLSVLANDTDPDGDTLSIASLDLTGTKGAVTINPDNSIAYDPTAAFNALNTGETATDSFKYNVSDGKGGTASATVTVSVTGITDTTTNPIVAENSLTGNPQGEWDLTNGPSSNIEGFATDISVNKGGTVGFKVNTNASKYRLDIYRSGYYGGMGARKIATVRPTITLPQAQPAAQTDAATGLVDAGNWAQSASWTVPTNATSGAYFAKLVREDGTAGENHIFFVVRDDESHSDLLFQTADTTWQAYNSWGGNNFYQGSPANRSYKVSYNRPFASATYGPVNRPLFDAEYPMIRWLEANGYNVSYSTGVDTDRRGAELLEHKGFLSVGHDEYWSGQQRANVEAARDAGVNLAFFSGNEVYWKTRWENSIDGSGTPYRTLVSYKETWANNKIDPNPAWTGTWRDPRFSPPGDGGRPENQQEGTLFQVDSYRLDTMRVPAELGKMRFWRNTSLANLASGTSANLTANVLGYEWNEDRDNSFRPSGVARLSDTTINVPNYILDYGNTVGPGTANHAMTLYRHPTSRALVFSAGTTRWSWGLDSNHINEPSTPDVRMRQATVNLFGDMGVQPTTLQSGLVAATKSTDTAAPVSTIGSPSGGTSVQAGSTVTISGTASDSGGLVGGVEVSTDGATSWHPATGRNSWTYTWTPQAAGAMTIKSRAVDDSGNLETPGAGVAVTVTAPTGPYSLWSNSASPATPDVNDTSPVELGVKFRSTTNGNITGIRFYKSANNTGSHVGSLWSATGTNLATATFATETASGWQQANFASPVPITAGTSYVASYHTNTGHYSANTDYFANSGVTNGPLYAFSSPESAGNGVYAYGANSMFPTSSYRSTNYWVDVVLAA